MTDQSRSTPRFAPVWPYVNEVPNALQTILPGGRVSVFNRGLTAKELEPLTGTFQTPSGKAFKAVGHVFLWLVYAQGGLWAAVLVLDGLFNLAPPSPEAQAWITEHLINTFKAFRDINILALSATVPVLAVLYTIHFVAWRKWRTSIAVAWGRAGDRLVRTKELPSRRREAVNSLGGDLDSSLRRLDPENPEHSRLVLDAVASVSSYIDQPVPTKGARRVAESASADPAVRKVREDYELDLAAEQAALQDAKRAVLAVQTLSRELKAAATEQKIIALAKSILEGADS